ncbi:MAG TPA: 2-oxoacid:acceptor oxidoreductase subunit alpha [Candidatus Lokiarchaeia archaeon]|nr:2-oxoacid:acceptor oxidoreductase subunit alpha [Candidatus Lokiarchaeia archaeon]
MWKIQDEITIVLCGAAGQGIQTVEDGLVAVSKKSGYHVFSSREYMSRVRGGVNSTSIRIASKPVRAFVDRVDILMPLTEQAIQHVKDRLTSKSVLIGEETYLNSSECGDCPKIEISYQDIAKEIGNVQYSNIVSLGVMSGIIDADEDAMHACIANLFPKKGEQIIQDNVRAADEGFKVAKSWIEEDKLPGVEIAKDPTIKDNLVLDGTDATALGALAGGCNFETFYPMSPSTGIATYLAQKALDFSLIVDQSEDEISAMNKSIGASFAGARAMVTTSGGGFSLMNEGLSLCGATELPLVIVVGQRPGPATGMPTRTEQGELEHVLYAGSGEFPRVIFAPGTIEDEFYLTQNAFNIAEKYQVPVFLLPDQYIIDASYDIPSLALDDLKVEKHFIKTSEGYIRYEFTETGISPRGIPGHGEGLTIADGHTHSEDGHITEDPIIRSKMVEKYCKKLDQLKKDVIPPELSGNPDYKTLVIGWGSTYYPILEALERIGKNDVAFLHFKQVYPVHESAIEYLQKADRRIIIENNSNAQFGNLLQLETGIKMDARILKYSGYCFSVEEITEKLAVILEE